MKSLALILLLLPTLIFANELTIKINPKDSSQAGVESFIESIQTRPDVQKFVFEAAETKKKSSPLLLQTLVPSDIYKKTYPNGDFYYLIGNLSDEWTRSDYERFYSIAKWLSKKGFRTILNVVTYIPDLQEAISNPQATAIVWNSHGNSSGGIYDSNDLEIPEDLFINSTSKSLRYILFGSCWGANAATKYQLNKIPNLVTMGWDRTVTSGDLFNFLFSNEFDESLAGALKVEIKDKSRERIPTGP